MDELLHRYVMIKLSSFASFWQTLNLRKITYPFKWQQHAEETLREFLLLQRITCFGPESLFPMMSCVRRAGYHFNEGCLLLLATHYPPPASLHTSLRLRWLLVSHLVPVTNHYHRHKCQFCNEWWISLGSFLSPELRCNVCLCYKGAIKTRHW